MINSTFNLTTKMKYSYNLCVMTITLIVVLIRLTKFTNFYAQYVKSMCSMNKIIFSLETKLHTRTIKVGGVHSIALINGISKYNCTPSIADPIMDTNINKLVLLKLTLKGAITSTTTPVTVELFP